MRKAIAILLIALAATGCVTQRRCNMKFPPSVVERVDSIFIDREVVRDTTVYVTLPKDTITKTDTVVVIKGVAFSSIIETIGNYSRAVAQVKNSKLTQTLYEGIADSLAIRLEGVIRERDRYKELSKQRSETRIEYKNTKFAKFTTYFFWIVMGIIAMLVLVVRVRITKNIEINKREEE